MSSGTQLPAVEAETLLCVKIASRGDLLLAAPAFAALRRDRPRARIVLVVGESCADVAGHLPFFDEIRTIDDLSLFSGTFLERARAAVALFLLMRGRGSRMHSRERFAEVFIFHRDRRYGLLARIAGIPVRSGLARGKGGSLTRAYRPPPREHDVLQYLEIVRRFDHDGESEARSSAHRPPELAGLWSFGPGERESGLDTARQRGFEAEGRWVALGFGGGHNVKTRTSLKSWPITSFRELARRLDELGFRIAWLGDANDARLLGTPEVGVSLAGELSVPESAAVIEACVAAVCNDSFLLHLSEAVGTPSVGLFGPTDPAHYGPLGLSSTVVWLGDSMACSPCHEEGYLPPCRFDHRCMREIDVEMVLERLRPLLATANDTQPAKAAGGR